MRIHEISGGGGLKLHVREWGPPQGRSILFIHGWSQSHLCWRMQWLGELADEFRLVAMDCRGHGMSDAPLEREHYTDSRLWADDVNAVITSLDLSGPVIVAWSYGGYVACDYLRFYGDTSLAGLNLVAGAVSLGPSAFGTLIGPGFLEHVPGAISEDLPTNIVTMRSFVRACVASSLAADDFETALCWNMVVPAAVRAALVARELHNDDVLRALTIPVLLTHGESDTVVFPAMSEHIFAAYPAAQISRYANVGHMPFLESPERFDSELAAFVNGCS